MLFKKFPFRALWIAQNQQQTEKFKWKFRTQTEIRVNKRKIISKPSRRTEPKMEWELIELHPLNNSIKVKKILRNIYFHYCYYFRATSDTELMAKIPKKNNGSRNSIEFLVNRNEMNLNHRWLQNQKKKEKRVVPLPCQPALFPMNLKGWGTQ